MRMREKLPGIGSCDGAKEEITVCDNEVNECDSLIVDIALFYIRKIKKVRLGHEIYFRYAHLKMM